MRKGQINRRVFGTLLNRVSSRSHGIFTIKIVRVPVNPTSHGNAMDLHAASSRLCIVDLAGSERTRNTQTTGERLKEAGNINKSLMVLGQCLEVIRQNQRREKGKKVCRDAHP
jgi:kinesin family protein 20